MRRAVVLAVLPVALAACGGKNSSKSHTGTQQAAATPVGSVQQAAEKTSKAASEHVDMNVAAAVQGQVVNITGTGNFDNAKHVGALVAHAKVQGVDLEIDEILAGTTLYLKSPFFAAIIPKGKTWLKLDLTRTAKAKGIDFDSLISQDPSRNFTQLQASSDATKIGDETVGGVATTHYRGHIDISKLPQGEKIQRATGVEYGPYDVWIGNDDGYVHRLRESYSYAVAGEKQTATLTMNFSAFGKPVTVNVPAASDAVAPSKQSLQGLGG
jgi:hypothetical protein